MRQRQRSSDDEARLLPPQDPPDVLRRLGFRCIEPTRFTLPDGSSVLVQASGWLLARKELAPSDGENGCLRLYHVYYPSGGTEELDEWDVRNLVGSEAFDGAL